MIEKKYIYPYWKLQSSLCMESETSVSSIRAFCFFPILQVPYHSLSWCKNWLGPKVNITRAPQVFQSVHKIIILMSHIMGTALSLIYSTILGFRFDVMIYIGNPAPCLRHKQHDEIFFPFCSIATEDSNAIVTILENIKN